MINKYETGWDLVSPTLLTGDVMDAQRIAYYEIKRFTQFINHPEITPDEINLAQQQADDATTDFFRLKHASERLRP